MRALTVALLIDELVQRDEPMTRSDLKKAFAEAGFICTEDDIDACSPDSEAAVAEQLAYYRE